MIRIGTYNGGIIEKGRRLIKSFVRSQRDVQTSYQVAPWGDDSQPVKNARVCHADTMAEDTLVLGVINTDQKAAEGERRIFATDADGNTVVDIWLRNDGTIEMAGSGDNLVKYIPLNQALTTYNSAINAELMKIQTAILSLGGAYAYQALTIDVTGAKADNLKTD